MKTFKNQAAQGDLLLRKIDSLPEGLTERKPVNGEHIVAHSETGHHHTVTASRAAVLESGNPMVCYLRVGGDGADLLHHRSYDTHEALHIPSGIYEMRRQREHTPEGWRRVED